MRRSPFVIAATVAGLAAVLNYHARGTGTVSAARHGRPRLSGPAAPASTAPAGPTTPVATTAPPAGPTRTATGARQPYGYGVLATRVTVRGSRIADVQVVGLQTAESYSQQLAAQAIPILRREVLAAQGPRISGVSGATYTAEAYATSVQSALDKLRR